MKKWLCLILALVMMLAFTACDDDASERDDDDKEVALYESTVMFTLDVNNAMDMSSDYNLPKFIDSCLNKAVELMDTSEYYELIADKADRDLTADDVEEMLRFEVDDACLEITVTHEAPRTLQAVRKAVLDESIEYVQNKNADILLVKERVGEVEKVDD